MDMNIKNDKLNYDRSYCLVSWSAIIAGALVAFSLSVLLNILNAGLGLVAFPETFRGMSGLGAGAYLWLIICGIIAMFIAGWVAGKIGQHCGGCCHGMLHGFLAWSLALLLTIMVAGHFAHMGASGVEKASMNDRADTSRIISQHEGPSAEQASETAGTITIGIFFIFLLGAASAAVGGYMGAKHGKDSQTHTPAPKY